jgi:hypothetical protein
MLNWVVLDDMNLGLAPREASHDSTSDRVADHFSWCTDPNYGGIKAPVNKRIIF